MWDLAPWHIYSVLDEEYKNRKVLYALKYTHKPGPGLKTFGHSACEEKKDALSILIKKDNDL